MRRMFLTVIVMLAIGALWAVSASACGTVGTPVVCSPAAYNTPGYNNNAPSPTQKKVLPFPNNGINTAAGQSPAIVLEGQCGVNF
jgi:hypothetical protein